MAEFNNPNQQGGQDGQTILSVLTMVILVVIGLQWYKTKSAPLPTTTTPAITQQQQTAAAPAVAMTATASANAAVPVVQAAAEQTTVIENDLYRITFSNRGADVTSWILKQYKDDNGKPLDLVHQQAAKAYGYPLSFYSKDASVSSGLNQALYLASATGRLTAPVALTFNYSNGDLLATKTFRFDPKTYLIDATVTVTRDGAPVAVQLSWPGGFGDQNETPNQGAYNNSQFDAYRNGGFDKLDAKKVAAGDSQSGPIDFAGIADPFFAAVFLPNTPATASVTTLRNDLDVSQTIKRVGFGSDSAATKPVVVPVLGVALGSSDGPIDTRIFVGPKAINILKSVHAADSHISLEPILEFGFWGVVGKYLFLTLYFIHTHVVSGWSGSWGWSIVFLTIIVNFLTLPSRIKTMQSALKMQRIQPQMDAIKEKYKKFKITDPKRGEMNAEIMQLQKDNGVNMFGGCIPNLITMPLFMAFYTMIPRVVDLRQAHWLWLSSLQTADPYHILPILTVLSMALVQFYTPSPGVDPQQQKMMAFTMPAVFGYVTWTAPAGLALYWAVNNMISIVQQSVMNRTSVGREMREIAAKRARRKATTIQGRK